MIYGLEEPTPAFLCCGHAVAEAPKSCTIQFMNNFKKQNFLGTLCDHDIYTVLLYLGFLQHCIHSYTVKYTAICIHHIYSYTHTLMHPNLHNLILLYMPIPKYTHHPNIHTHIPPYIHTSLLPHLYVPPCSGADFLIIIEESHSNLYSTHFQPPQLLSPV